MKLEDIATPQRQTPQVRYASLNRTIEGGLATDQTWSELTRVCLELGRDDEACSAFQRVRDVAARRRLLVYLHRRGLMLHLDPASLAPPPGAKAADEKLETSDDTVADLIADALRYLFVDHMPLAVIVATVIFPVVVGVGGALSSTAGSTLFLPLIAMIPAVSILGLVGAMGRRILLESAKGLDDPPEIPTFQVLGREALRFVLDGAVLGVVFLAPGFLLGIFGAGAVSAVAGVAFGGLLLPMAMTMRQSHDDWSCLHPPTLFRTVAKSGTRYLGCALFAIGVFTPALLSVWFTRDSHIYLIVSVVGPLAVAPLFMVSRMMGQVLYLQQREERRKSPTRPQTERKPTAQALGASATPHIRRQLRTPLRGATQHPEAAPTAAKRPTWPGPSPSAPTPPRMRTRAATQAPAPVSPRPAGLGFFGNPTPTPGPAPAPMQASASMPELAHMPGARVLRGEARKAAGAAAPTRPK